MASQDKVQISTPSDREVVISRTFDAPRHLVFKAWTTPELVQRWLLGPPGTTMPVCEMDLRVGGAIRWVWRSENGDEMGLSGVCRQVIPNERLVHTELFDEDWTGGETTITIDFLEEGGKTTVRMTVLYASQKARDAAIQTDMADGMNMGYDRLAELLKTLE
jgi:uncharacterized protein YndB with AHSA1/START domain